MICSIVTLRPAAGRGAQGAEQPGPRHIERAQVRGREGRTPHDSQVTRTHTSKPYRTLDSIKKRLQKENEGGRPPSTTWLAAKAGHRWHMKVFKEAEDTLWISRHISICCVCTGSLQVMGKTVHRRGDRDEGAGGLGGRGLHLEAWRQEELNTTVKGHEELSL